MWAINSSFASTALLDALLQRRDIDTRRALALLCSAYTRADVKSIFDQLYALKADVNEPAKHSNTPLHKACQNRAIGAMLVRLLIAKDAMIEQTNVRRETPLFEAVKLDHEECVRVLLANGADPLAMVYFFFDFFQLCFFLSLSLSLSLSLVLNSFDF